MRSNGWVLAVILVIFLYFSFSSLNSITSSKGRQQRNDLVIERRNPFQRLNSTLLTSVLAHIRVGYMANRTPDFDTPPLLVLYSCKENNSCGSLEERLLGITSAYMFSMLWDGAAVGIDMDTPIKFDWFFETSPSYMCMNPGQVKFYLERADPATIRRAESMHDLQTTDFVSEYTSQNIHILEAGNWAPWWTLRENAHMKVLRDKYQLEKLERSEGFWIASQLLFSKPSEWLADRLSPYQNIMGGGEMYVDPLHKRPTMEGSIRERWTRVGVRMTSAEGADCIAARAAFVCSRAKLLGKQCHLFLSGSSPEVIEALRSAIAKRNKDEQPMVIHAVAEHYEFTPLSMMTGDPVLTESDEKRTKLLYARSIMDWVILSRMDYLIGTSGDDYLKTAAWAAQVQTDLYFPDNVRKCLINAMEDW
ncbi:hypothetical protein BX666DRAFT_2028622 [Dichotomocladium elegans]|nr:hypothetical protein BX666DRAFT_2028622 [Dichotomocladium elegans]